MHLNLRQFGLTSLLILIATTAAFAQALANDNFADAIVLNGPIATTTGSNVGATKPFGGGAGEPSIPPQSLGTFGGASVWWRWTATASGTTTVDTEGSSFNTLLGIYTGTAVNQLTLAASNDDFEGNPWSKVTFEAVAGTTYNIMVDGFRSGAGFGAPATGSIVLHVKGVGGLDISLANGSVFNVGDPIPVSVSFTPDFPNPPATRVEFYRQSSPFTAPVLVTTDNAEPFSATIEGAPAGTNSIYVVAYDSLGGPVASPVASVLVQNIGVTLLTPFEDTVYPTTAPITVTASTFLPAGNISSVEFFVDGVKFAESIEAPYSGTWSNVTGGSHRFTAVARSEAGARYTSQAVNVGVITTLLPFGSVWKYLDNGSDQGTAWYATEFDDSSWASGPAPFGYADSNGRFPATTNSFGPDANAKFPTTYFRQAVEIGDTASFSSVRLNIERDDGAIIYLNGAELTRFNMPTGEVTYATFAAANANDDGGTVFGFNIDRSLLRPGVNVFAVEIHNDAGNSSDIWFQMSLVGQPVIIHNLSPVVDVTTPTNGAYFLAPSQIALAATASDGDGSVAKVEFFANGVKIGEDTEAPYEAIWNNPPVAAHQITAVATDDQGATTTSAEIAVVVYDAAGTPVAKVTAPLDGHIVEGPTNMVVTATANAVNGVANVEFFNNGVLFASDNTAPYSAIWPAPFGTNTLTAVSIDTGGVRGTSPAITVAVTIPPTNVIAPTVFRQTPLASASVTNTLTSINVLFSERVLNVDASDLLINGVPATNMTSNGSLTNYTFTFPQPAYGTVNITWAEGHGITDYGYPSNLAFDTTAPDATWSYILIDQLAPRIVARTPAPGSTVTNLTEITVAFSEPVSGVDAADLLVNGFEATAVSGSGANYTFTLPPFSTGLKTVTWSTNNGIADLAVTPNAFDRALATNNWSFTLDTRYVFIQTNANWHFIKGFAEASEPTNAWRQLAYDDSSWSNAPAPFFYGETAITNAAFPGTTLSDMQSNYTTIYLRREFVVEKRGNITNLIFLAQVDDGFVAWINGVPMTRFNAPAGDSIPYNAVATAQSTEPNNAGAAWTVFQMPASASALVDGTNVIAVQAFNQNLTNSSDFSFNAQLYTYLLDPTTVGPRLLEPEPRQGDTFALSNILITFSEPVHGVKASDLLINGTPATEVSSTTNTTYLFSFPQPPYGAVVVNWDTNHAIVDFDSPPRAFDALSTNSTLRYFLINPSNPKIASQVPSAGLTVTGLTAVVVTFTEAVAGVEASDLLINGTAAASMTTADNTSFQFAFPQPAFGAVTIRWATNHGIVDVEAGNAFDPTRFGGQWNYTLIDPVPSVVLTSPTNNTFFLPPANLTLRATASDNDGTVALVEFFQSGEKLSEGTTAPYTFGVSNLLVGSYTFTARATDNQGLQRTSAPVVINVVTSLPIALIRGPYLQMGSPTGSVVRWRTDAISDGLVYYGTDLNSMTNIAWEQSVTNEHVVKLSELEPGTKYYYSIGSGAFRLVGGTNDGANYWFETSPPVGTRNPTRLWILGDAGTAGNGSPDRQRSTRDAFYNYAETNGGAADLVLMLGDNAYNVGSDAEHQAAVFDMYPTTLRNKFLWPTIGNHETSQSTTATDFPYLNIFSLPTAGEAGGVPSGTEKYYSFDYGNIHFVCLDSMTSGLTGTTPMARWLEDDLANTAQEWVIVFFHHPPYTKGSHNSDTEQDLVQIRQNLVPILEANGVDLVLSGHSHCYERSYLMDGHYGLSGTLTESMKIDGGDGSEDGDGAYRKNDEGRGVIYTVAGSAGQATFLQADAPLPAMQVTLLELGSMVVDVTGNRLDAVFLRENGLIQDRFTLIKPSPFPAAPQNLVAATISTSEISLSWTDATENELAYVVERSTDGVNFTTIQTLVANSTNLLDSGLLANTTYLYRVRGTNSIGIGEYSNIAGASTVLPDSLPAAPIGLVAHADDGSQFFRHTMVLRWQDRSTNESAFQIERAADGANFLPVASVAANQNTYIDRNLESATYYHYRVRAVNALGASAPTVIATESTHPQTQLVREGGNAVFHAGAEGAAPVRYQWNFLGIPIAGETNETLLVENVQPGDEGDFDVIVRDANGRTDSNPAFLFVLSPPSIVTHPSDIVAIAGTTVALGAQATGTQPLIYQWVKNGTPINGANSAAIDFSSVQIPDRGRYYLTVRNDFGATTSQVAQLDVFFAPTLAAIPDTIGEVLKQTTIRNRVTDMNVPPLNLLYTLEAGAPTNATINPTNGVIRWRPNRAQGPSTNVITARVSDGDHPSVNTSVSFTVVVKDFVELTIGQGILQTGETNVAPIQLFSSTPIVDAQFQINFDATRLTNLSVVELAPERARVSLQLTAPDTAKLSIVSEPGVSLQGTQQLAQLQFEAIAGVTSAFVPLHASLETGTRAEAGLEPTLLANDGRAVVIGTQPLLEPTFTSPTVRQMMLYGRRGTTYTVEASTNIANPLAWRARGTLPGATMTNLFRVLPLPATPAPPVYYRIR
ncbi:MAG: metallophosphoesterase, partial [Verrucomicrobia bacterium]|nr:metallophosphoesterase [Verrucomicrobiota bacterium]